MKTTNEILAMVEQYKEAAQLIELAQAEQEKLKAEITAALAERNVNYLEVGCHKVRLSDFSSTRLDSKPDHPTVGLLLYPDFLKEPF